MYITVPEEIKELSDIFTKNGEVLYIVGGFVRDNIIENISKEHNDTDLCSAVKPEKLVNMLSGTKFTTDDTNKMYGTVIINGTKRYEHTTFRRENYNLNGEHNPTGVEFIKDIREDALRRDFTINAIYYRVDNGDIIDPVSGIEHLKNKLIITPANANTSFKEDSERILRMIRFSCSLNFKIDDKTLIAASENYRGVSVLSKQRIRSEFNKMLECDTYYNDKNSKYAHAKCMLLLGELDLWQYILPAIDEIFKSNITDEKGELLYSHIINTLSVCDKSCRLACLLHDVGKVYTKSINNNFKYSLDWSQIIIEKNLGQDGLKYSKNIIEETKKIVSALDYDKYGLLPKRNLKQFIRANIDIFDKICYLKDAIALENTNYSQKSKIAKRWKKQYQQIKSLSTPLSLSELNITGDDIIDTVPEINVVYIGEILNKLLDTCLYHPRLNNKNYLISYAKKLILKNPNKYLE